MKVSVRFKGDEQGDESVLPPGQRDRTGFWLPLGHDSPRTLVRRRRSRAGVETRRRETEATDEISPS